MPRPDIARPVWTALGLLTLALALRVWDFGNPVIHVDEQYYLLVGDRMLHGAVPYIDIWDRKPIGLFLIYAAIRLLPGDGILTYQIVATLFAAATAFAIERGARAIGAMRSGALAAGAAYLIWIALLGGRGGQSPVFYNLFMAVAALLTLRLPALAEAGARRGVVVNGSAACLLAGLAIQTKYVPAVEGAYFGVLHLWYLRRAGGGVAAMAGAGAVWALLGAAPTLAVIGWYHAIGPQAYAMFRFANFGSIALRPGYPLEQIVMRLLGIAAQLAPLAVSAAIAWRWRPTESAAAARVRIVTGWVFVAVAAFLLVGTYFDHYALPLIAPLAIAAGPALGRSSRARIASLGLALMLFAIELSGRREGAQGARDVARVVAANSRGGCPYVFIGDTATYYLAKSCLPTRYAFPNLLAYRTEQGATGIDEAAEVRRILATRPPVIVTSSRKLDIWNHDSLMAVKAALGRDYRLVFSTPRAGYRTLVYLRRDLSFRR